MALLGLLVLACGGDGEAAGAARPAGATQPAAEPEKVGYDLRRLRPTTEEPLVKTFERMHAQARAEGKQVAMLFSAEWCERCSRLELELGNLHPTGDIAHVRILELVEEDWEQALRMNEFELLRQRWDTTKGTYPLFVVLDDAGGKVEEMKEAVERLEHAGQAATVATWFRGLRQS
jgi:hypothetical protein